MEAELDLTLLRRARVIGMTSTGAAKYKSLYERLDIEVVVVEEAAELLESHVVTALSPSVKHLIMIGSSSSSFSSSPLQLDSMNSHTLAMSNLRNASFRRPPAAAARDDRFQTSLKVQFGNLSVRTIRRQQVAVRSSPETTSDEA